MEACPFCGRKDCSLMWRMQILKNQGDRGETEAAQDASEVDPTIEAMMEAILPAIFGRISQGGIGQRRPDARLLVGIGPDGKVLGYQFQSSTVEDVEVDPKVLEAFKEVGKMEKEITGYPEQIEGLNEQAKCLHQEADDADVELRHQLWAMFPAHYGANLTVRELNPDGGDKGIWLYGGAIPLKIDGQEAAELLSQTEAIADRHRQAGERAKEAADLRLKAQHQPELAGLRLRQARRLFAVRHPDLAEDPSLAIIVNTETGEVAFKRKVAITGKNDGGEVPVEIEHLVRSLAGIEARHNQSKAPGLVNRLFERVKGMLPGTKAKTSEPGGTADNQPGS